MTSIIQTGTDNRLPHAPSPNFLYFYHPFQWAVQGGEWLPQIAEHRQSPGQGNVGKNGEMTLAVAHRAKLGWQLVPPDIIEGGYVRVHDGKRGPVHLSKWERPRVVAGMAAESEIDRAGYLDFLRLVAAHFNARPDRDVVRRAIARAENAVEQALSNNGEKSKVYTAAVERLETIRAATSALETTAPKRRSRAKKGAA